MTTTKPLPLFSEKADLECVGIETEAKCPSLVHDSNSPNTNNTAFSPLKSLVSASVGSMITSVFVTPFDVVKTRLQIQEPSGTNKYTLQRPMQRFGTSAELRLSGTWDGFVQIARSEGLRGLWRGLGPTLTLSIPSTAMYYTTYEMLRGYIQSQLSSDSASSSYWTPLIAGSVARLMVAAATTPLELIRTNIQAQGKNQQTPMDTMRSALSKGGLRGMFLGLTPTLLRDVPFSAVYWLTYEQAKLRLTETTALRSANGNTNSFAVSFCSGAIAGMIAATVTTPSDVVKTRIQGQQFREAKTMQPMTHVFRDIVRNEGYRGLFIGLTPRLVKVAPSCAIMISSYELLKQWLA